MLRRQNAPTGSKTLEALISVQKKLLRVTSFSGFGPRVERLTGSDVFGAVEKSREDPVGRREEGGGQGEALVPLVSVAHVPDCLYHLQ